ncbi:MAG: Gfo/Idh/MocA family oxidoreductase [Myxococcales bacterium]|nr:Gfo/Idh/MocA family oxidoreductase [Myxococcales bacterium]
MTPLPSTLRLGIVGLGAIGRHHARLAAAHPGVTLVGAADPAGDRHGALPGHPVLPDLPALLALGLDAAILATPPARHAAAGRALAQAGVATLIEKPLAPSRAEAHALVDAFAAGPPAAVGHVERFNPALPALRAALAEHAGPLAIERLGPAPRRRWALDAARDLAIHDLDLLAWLLGPVDVQGAAGHPRALQLHGTAGGRPFTLTVDAAAPRRRRRWQVGPAPVDLRPAALAAGPEPLAAQLDAFVTLCRTGAPGPLASLPDGLAALHAAEHTLRLLAAPRLCVRPGG